MTKEEEIVLTSISMKTPALSPFLITYALAATVILASLVTYTLPIHAIP